MGGDELFGDGDMKDCVYNKAFLFFTGATWPFHAVRAGSITCTSQVANKAACMVNVWPNLYTGVAVCLIVLHVVGSYRGTLAG